MDIRRPIPEVHNAGVPIGQIDQHGGMGHIFATGIDNHFHHPQIKPALTQQVQQQNLRKNFDEMKAKAKIEIMQAPAAAPAPEAKPADPAKAAEPAKK